MDVSIYLLRHQRGGIITDRAFTKSLDDASLAREKAALDARFGEGWLRVVSLPMALPEGVYFAAFEPFHVPDRIAESSPMRVVVSAVAEVVNP